MNLSDINPTQTRHARTRERIDIDPAATVFVTRVEQYVQALEGGPEFNAHITQASIRPSRHSDGLSYLPSYGGTPVLEAITDRGDKALLAMTSKRDELTGDGPLWELRITKENGHTIHSAGGSGRMIWIFQKLILQGAEGIDAYIKNVTA